MRDAAPVAARASGLDDRATRARRASAASRARLAALLALALASAGCSSTSEVDKNRFELFRDTSRNYYDRGSYPQALHQANMALAIESDDEQSRLIKAFCLIKIGNLSHNPILLDDSLKLFEAILSTSAGRKDYRASMGLGSACLARSFEHDREIARIEKRLSSDFLSSGTRAQDELIVAQEQAARRARLVQGETALRRVLDDPLQKDNPYAMVDLVLTLNALGGRDEEALALAARALEELDQSTKTTQGMIQKNTRISATAKIDLDQRVTNNREKEVLLRDLVATVHYNRGDMDGFFEQMTILEQRKIMGEIQYFNRANVFEKLGMFDAAAADLDRFLRLRGKRLTYEQDDMAPAVFDRIERLHERQAEALAQTPR